jgi:hypothetical protein
MSWVQRPSGLIKMEGSASAKSRECFMESNIDNRSKSLSDIMFGEDRNSTWGVPARCSIWVGCGLI